jgi:hypothetical protein
MTGLMKVLRAGGKLNVEIWPDDLGVEIDVRVVINGQIFGGRQRFSFAGLVKGAVYPPDILLEDATRLAIKSVLKTTVKEAGL